MRASTVVLLLALTAAAQPAPEASAYLLGPDDQIVIRALHAVELGEKPYLINSGGHVTVPMLGQVKAAGLSVEQFERVLVEKLGEFLTDPQVVVNIVEYRSQPVSVLGSVNKPGVYQLRGPRTLLEVLSMAEGMKPDASQVVELTRRKEHGPIPRLQSKEEEKVYTATINVASVLQGRDPAGNIVIKPHDVISVPVAEKVYVLGLVQKPGPFGLTDGRTMSVLEALSAAGGPSPYAAPHKARILRVVPGTTKRTEIAVNLNHVIEGRNTDLVLGPEDILYVPNSASKNISLKVMEAALQTATGMAIWWPRGR
jgi:polysaccharide export outer membrane protein